MLVEIQTDVLRKHGSAAAGINKGTLQPVLKTFCFRTIEDSLWLISTDGVYTYAGVVAQTDKAHPDCLVDSAFFGRAIRSLPSGGKVQLVLADKKLELISDGGTFAFSLFGGGNDFPNPDLKSSFDQSNLLAPSLQEALAAAASLVVEHYPYVTIATREDTQLLEVLTTNSCYRKIASVDPKDVLVPGAVDKIPVNLVRSLTLNREDEISLGGAKAFGQGYTVLWTEIESPYPDTDSLFKGSTDVSAVFNRKQLAQLLTEASSANQIFVTIRPDGTLAALSDIVQFESKLQYEGLLPEDPISFNPETLLPFLTGWVRSEQVEVSFLDKALMVESEERSEICCVAKFFTG